MSESTMVWKEVEINRLEMVPVPLCAMLEMVAFKRGLREEYADLWCNVMSASFADLGIHSLRVGTWLEGIALGGVANDDCGSERHDVWAEAWFHCGSCGPSASEPPS